MKKLLWRCDDFGSATGANEAILRVARLGLPVNVSVMVCAPEARTGLDELARLGHHVCLGIHSAVNSEWTEVKWGPVDESLRATKLVDANGHFHPDYEILYHLPPEQIAGEIEAQIKRGLEWNIPFSYLDEHMGFAWLAGVAPMLEMLASTYGLVYRRDLPGLPELKAANKGLVDQTAQQLDAVDDELPRLAVFHPCVDDASTRRFFLGQDAPGLASRVRQQELDALTSEDWRRLMTSPEVKLMTYRDL